MEFEEQPHHYRSEVSNEPNDNTAYIIFLSQSRFESFGAHNPKLRPLRDFAPTLSCISATCPTVDMFSISSVCITPSYRLQKTPLYNRLATFPLRLGSGNPSATSREKIPTMGPDTHVPSTPSVQDITSCGEYHRIKTVWLKSQADETLPNTPIGRTPERREIADIHRLPSTPSISCSGENALPNKGRYLNLF